jgi:hypothetical protein
MLVVESSKRFINQPWQVFNALWFIINGKELSGLWQSPTTFEEDPIFNYVLNKNAEAREHPGV